MMVIRVLVSAAVIALSASCSSRTPGPDGIATYRAYDQPARRAGDPSSVEVRVSTSRQRVYVVEDGRPLLVMPVTVGADETPTPHGTFRIERKELRKRSTRQGFARSGGGIRRTPLREKPPGWSFTGTPLPYWCEFSEGLAFHSGWIRHRPATEGSIRMHENLAPKFFALVRVGTPVTIAEWLPEDREFASIPLPPDAGPLPDDPPEFYLGDAYFTRHKPPVWAP